MRSPISEKKRAVEIGPAPFARARIHVEGEERVPMRLGDVASGEPFDGDAVRQRVAALAPDRLALARGERGEKILEAPVAVVEPVELLVVAAQKALRVEGVEIVLLQERGVDRGGARLVPQRPQAGDQMASGSRDARAPFGTRRRGPVAGVNGTETCSFG